MLLRDVLTSKGAKVITTDPGATVLDAARSLVQHNVGSLVVTAGVETVGILTERDILRLSAARPDRLDSTKVGDVMTTDLVVGLADDEVAYAMAIMTNNRVRHLPILEAGRLAGIVSLGDLVNASLSSLEAENRWLRDYVQGGG